jgi:hypothetical protein
VAAGTRTRSGLGAGPARRSRDRQRFPARAGASRATWAVPPALGPCERYVYVSAYVCATLTNNICSTIYSLSITIKVATNRLLNALYTCHKLSDVYTNICTVEKTTSGQILNSRFVL